jgi:hypothetical protein
MPELGQLRTKTRNETVRMATRKRMTRSVRGRGCIERHSLYKTLYAYQMPKQILKTAATVCSPWWR